MPSVPVVVAAYTTMEKKKKNPGNPGPTQRAGDILAAMGLVGLALLIGFAVYQGVKK